MMPALFLPLPVPPATSCYKQHSVGGCLLLDLRRVGVPGRRGHRRVATWAWEDMPSGAVPGGKDQSIRYEQRERAAPRRQTAAVDYGVWTNGVGSDGRGRGNHVCVGRRDAYCLRARQRCKGFSSLW